MQKVGDIEENFWTTGQEDACQKRFLNAMNTYEI